MTAKSGALVKDGAALEAAGACANGRSWTRRGILTRGASSTITAIRTSGGFTDKDVLGTGCEVSIKRRRIVVATSLLS